MHFISLSRILCLSQTIYPLRLLPLPRPEYYAIIEALTFISNLTPNNYLIASDSMSCLLALKSNPFNSHLPPCASH